MRDWTLPLVVDGRPAIVAGTLDYVPGPSPLPYLALTLLTAAAATLLLGIYWTPVYDWASSSLAMWLPKAPPATAGALPLLR